MRRTIWLFASLGVLATMMVIEGCGNGSTAPLSSSMSIAIDQASPVSVAANGTKQFSATITGTSNTAVTWTVQEGATGGSFSQTTNGLYTAPATAGTYHVVATSVADNSKKATATVNVTASTGNTAPTASFTVTPSSGPASTSFAVDASGSTDAQDATSALQVRWDWENDGVWDTAFSATKTANHTYASAGTYTINLEVRDTGGLSSTVTHTVTVTAAGATFTLTLDNTVDTSSGSSKASTFTSAALLDTTGTSVKTGAVNNTTATFDLSGLSAGTYFVQVNGLTNDLVPVRIDDTTTNGTAFVGTRLRDVLIGTKASPTYRVKTFSLGQSAPAVVKYSNGTAATPTRYAYAILLLNLNPQQIEIRTLGSAALLASHTAGGYHTFATWMLGSNNHGINYGGVDNNCNGCHNSLDTHAASYSSIVMDNGWCYTCHYGKSGSSAGMVDPAQ